MLAYAGAVAVTIYVIFDLDYPRSGWIRLDAADSGLVKLHDSIRWLFLTQLGADVDLAGLPASKQVH
jgi:hypothetical protein